ncbi:MAG: TRAP transporter permease [Defluviitaleaceae bacterium]|nr:TRAP transporter permease [Defluviitaleaceae bacterium]
MIPFFKKKEQPQPDAVTADGTSELSSAEIAAKFEKASAFRNNLPQKITFAIGAILVAYSTFQIYASIFTIQARQLRPIHLAFALVLVFLLYPAGSKQRRDRIEWYDYILAGASAFVTLYIPWNLDHIVRNIGNYGTTEIVIGAVAILLVLEACRRIVGLPILVIVVAFLLYTFFGNMIPGAFGHRGFNMTQTVTHMYYTLEGVFGTPLGVSATFIFLFVLFGAFLEKTGVGALFIDLANALAGRYSGGPAKVTVIASAFQGTVSGSSVANAAATGPFTIPAMKKLGYKPEFAGAVEAAASTGGQIVPPVMGAAAFLMAEITGYSYGMIVVASAIPALLYFAGVLISTHHEARKLGLKGMDPENIPKVRPLMRERGYLIMPLVFIIYMLATRATPSFAAMAAMLTSLFVYSAKWWGIIPVIVMAFGKDVLNIHFTQYTLMAIGVWLIISLFRREIGLTVFEIADIFKTGARNALSVVIACATAGMIVGAVTLTGVGLTFGNALAALAGGNIYLLMIFTMFASLILGLGVPTTAKYLIIATVCAPAMISSLVVMQGLDAPTTAIILSVHMFVFYFGVAADITPPVALVTMATSAIAGSDTFKTSIIASKIAIAAFLVPFIFVLHPSMLLVDTTIFQAAPSVLTALIGMYSLAGGLAGYVNDKCTAIERLLLISAGIFMVYPELISDIVGITVLILIIVIQKRRVSKRISAA